MSATEINGETVLWVRRRWNGSDRAAYRLADVSGFHWSSTGSIHNFRGCSPRPMVHAYVWCDAELEGELAHSCEHGPPPHSVNVTVVAKDNPAALMRFVKELATNRARGFAR